jgi:hypothetical protein
MQCTTERSEFDYRWSQELQFGENGVRAVVKKTWDLQLEYLEVTVQEKLRSGWPGTFVKVEGCCD